ncbi:unnamed protein product [Sphagnum jensenii]|uniref:Cytochrome P450 n=1 Tax=Sphagnum jensenii TaxID=128206 RepID=A0ABP0WDM9_9BRYO
MMGVLQQQEAGVMSGGDLNGGLGMTQMLLQQAMMINGMTLPVIAVAAGMWWRWQRAVVMSKSKLRGSSGFPLLGETMAYMSQMGSPLANFVDNKAKRYGKLFKTHLFFQPTVIAAEEEEVRMIVQKEGKLFDVNYPTSFANLLGPYNGLNIVGHMWKRMRRFIVANVLKPELLRERVNFIEDMVIEALSSWEGRTVFVEDEARALAFHVTALIVLNIHPGELNDKIKEDMYILIKGMFFLPIDLPWTAYGKGMRARERVVKTLTDYLESRPVKDDIYDKFIQTIREDSPEDTEEMLRGQGRDLLTGLLFAGHDTTAATMVFTVKYVGENPHVLAEIRKEHENVIKLKQPGERLTWEDCKAMSFTQDVITETLRLCNVSTTTFRKSLEDVHVGGKLVIPKGWMVLPYFRSVHYDPTFYPDPYKFNPWRYKEAGTKLPFFGFGGGARLCPGSELARTEICILLHHLVTKFDSWEFIGKDIPSFFPFPRLSKRLPIRVKPRQKTVK